MTFLKTAPGSGNEFVIEISQLHWQWWGRRSVSATAPANVNVGDTQFPGSATITLDRLRPHAVDGCGRHRHPGIRLYTRARVKLTGRAASVFDPSYTIALPPTGCETY